MRQVSTKFTQSSRSSLAYECLRRGGTLLKRLCLLVNLDVMTPE